MPTKKKVIPKEFSVTYNSKRTGLKIDLPEDDRISVRDKFSAKIYEKDGLLHINYSKNMSED